MTREELIEKVASSIYKVRNGAGCQHWGRLPNSHKLPYIQDANAAINTIFDALKEPTGKMTDASRHLMLWLGDNRPTEKALAFWCERRGLPIPEGCCDVDHVPPKAQQAAWVFQAMIAASPLAQEEKK